MSTQIQMVNPNFHNIDLGNYNNGNQSTNQNNNFNQNNGMMLNQQQMQQHVVPQHLNSNNHQLLRNVPDGGQYPTNSPSSLNLTSNKSSTNTPQISHLQASPANLTNSPSAISSPITISNNSSLNSPSTSSCSPSLLLNGTSNKRIMISQQTCLVEEKFSKNGVQKNVHVVVKNNPFLLTLSLLDPSLNFHQLTPEVQLVYDSESLKEVDSATVKPLEYKTRANEEGDQLTIELRIKVLSSQLEDMLFRAKVKIVDPRTRKETHGLSVITHPIRVVSKPDQVKKKAKKRKRAPTDSLMDTLNRIEHQQKEQQRLLKKLCYHDKENNINSLLQQQQNNFLASTNNNNNTTTTTTTCNNNNNIDDSTAIVKIEKQNDTIDCNNTNSEIVSGGDDSSSAIIKPILNGKDEFQSAFKEFIGAFKQLQCLDPDGADGAFKINTCANDAQTMCEILEMVKVELKKDENFKNKCNGNGNGACGENDPDNPCSCKVCPYKQKVDHINQSYETYFNMFNPSNTTSVVPQSQMIGNQQQAQQQQIDYSAYIDPTQIQAQQQVQLQAQQQLQMQQQYMQQQAQQQTMDQQQQQQQYYLQQYHLQQQQQQQRYLMQQQQQYLQQQQQQSNSTNGAVQQTQPNQQLDFQNPNNFIDFNSGLNFMNFSNIGFNSGLGDIGFS